MSPARVLAVLVLLLVGGCGPGDRLEQLEPLPEIDLSALQSSFAGRAREQKALVDRLLGASDTTDVELAEAFGEMGKLLQMSELVEPGLVCYRNAIRLAPASPPAGFSAATGIACPS